MPDKAYWEKRIAELQTEREQLIAMLNRVNGAIQECNLAIEKEQLDGTETVGIPAHNDHS